jgi:hypothetical protein
MISELESRWKERVWVQFKAKTDSKAISETGRREILMIPHSLDNRLTDGGKAVGNTRRPRSTQQKHYFSASGTHFC